MSDNIFALVYIDYEREDLVALGNRDEIIDIYNKYKNEIELLREKYDMDNVRYHNLPDEFFNEKHHEYKEVGRLCIQGYRNNEIQCLCNDFGIKIREPIFY